MEQVPIDAFFKMPVPPDALSLKVAAKNATVWTLIDVHQYSSELHRLRNTDFKSLWSSNDYVSVHLNGAVWNHFVQNDYLWEAGEKYSVNKYSKRQLFELVMREFFSTPAPALGSFIVENYARLPVSYQIGLQMRIGGQWGDGSRYAGDKKSVASCFISETLKICQAWVPTRNCSVFLTTDDPEAGAIVSAALQSHGIVVVQSEGTTVHSEKSDGSESDHLKPFGDWYILSLMSRLVASRSGFSETASWFGNVPSRALTKVSTCLFTDESTDIPDGAELFQTEAH